MVNQFWFLIDLLSGFIIGLILWCFFERTKYFPYHHVRSFFATFFSSSRSPITERDKLGLVNSDDLSRTWMYELRNRTYDSQKFSLTMANICFIEMKQNILFVFRPSSEPSHKLNEEELDAKVSFNQVRIYHLNDVLVGLLPMNMRRSKYWSKKSPIVLQNILLLKTESIQASSTNRFIPSDIINEMNVRHTLFLFTRTRRSKEDWFYRFVNGSQLNSWRKEIHGQLEHEETIDTTQQDVTSKGPHRQESQPMVDSDQGLEKRMINFLERTDRFAAPDQLTYLKPIDIVQKNLLNSKREKRNKNRKQSPDLRGRSNYKRGGRSLSNDKQQYCERWLMEQNQKSQSNHAINMNHAESQPSQFSLHTTSKQFEHQTPALLFFVLKYLQKRPHATIDNNIEDPVFFLNVFASRCFLDIFDQEEYLQRIKIFLQKQLGKIRIPLIEHISITNLNLGDRLPEIKDIFKPWVDEHGLWSHIKISYDGKLQLTLNAKLKWVRKHRLTDQISDKNKSLFVSKSHSDKRTHVPLKESSWRKRLWPPTKWFLHRRSFSKTSASKKTNLHSFVQTNKQDLDRSSNLERNTVKISKTTIAIKIEVNKLDGILLFNIPSIPSDRIWIGFLDMPDMTFSATPHLGEYRVPFYRIKERLEKKLRQIVRRYFVMPNMKDLIIPTVNDYLLDGDFIKVISSDMQVDDQQI